VEDSNLVLIVDDDPETARLLGHALSPDWHIATAGCSDEASRWPHLCSVSAVDAQNGP
jgi:CheY-like chemotaxis protein